MGRTLSASEAILSQMAQDTTDDERLAVGEPAPEDAEPALEPPPPVPPARVAPVVVPRWVQMVLLPLAIVGAYLLLKAAGRVLMLFTIAALISLLLNPIVALVQRTRLPRGAAVAIVIITLLVALTGLGFLLANPVSDQASTFQKNVPGWVDDANQSLANVQDWLDRNNINVQVKKEGQTALQTLGDRVAGGTGDVVSFTRDAVQTLVEGALALILVIVLTVYMLLYGDRIGAVVRADRAAGRRDAGGRLPDAHPGGGVRLRARAAAVQPDHGHERGHRALRPRLARDLPGGRDLRRRVRRLLWLRGADPVRRAGRRRASRRS